MLHELGYQDNLGWTPDLWDLLLEETAQRIQRLFPDHPLYGQKAEIPLEQKRGWRAMWPLLKQAWALVWSLGRLVKSTRGAWRVERGT